MGRATSQLVLVLARVSIQLISPHCPHPKGGVDGIFPWVVYMEVILQRGLHRGACFLKRSKLLLRTAQKKKKQLLMLLEDQQKKKEQLLLEDQQKKKEQLLLEDQLLLLHLHCYANTVWSPSPNTSAASVDRSVS